LAVATPDAKPASPPLPVSPPPSSQLKKSPIRPYSSPTYRRSPAAVPLQVEAAEIAIDDGYHPLPPLPSPSLPLPARTDLRPDCHCLIL
jgi:hypothetical protein